MVNMPFFGRVFMAFDEGSKEGMICPLIVKKR